jgi:hypothetical protein
MPLEIMQQRARHGVQQLLAMIDDLPGSATSARKAKPYVNDCLLADRNNRE